VGRSEIVTSEKSGEIQTRAVRTCSK